MSNSSRLRPDGNMFLGEQNPGLHVSRLKWDLYPRAEPSFCRHVELDARRWQDYKDSLGLLDFTDLIDQCLRDVPLAPGSPAVVFADEAQDLNRMQLTLVRKWGERANYFIVAGDDDQTAFSFTGATPEAILDPDIPADHKIILKQSYRVPRAVHALAGRFIRQVTRRQEKEYLPRPFDGAVERLTNATYRSPEYFILSSATKRLEQGKTVMFLASCSYMLRPVIQVLRKNGIPFHNPYRKSNGFWNPLRIGKKNSSANRVLALLVAHPDFGEDRRDWTIGDLSLWTQSLQSKGILKHGSKKRLLTAAGTAPVTIETLDEIFETRALESLLATFDGDYRALLDWWHTRVTADLRKRVEFFIQITKTGGALTLLEPPRVVVGTIHSVKGGQADVVYLFPDVS